MTYIRTIAKNEATGVIKRQYDAAQGRVGKVANIIQLMSLDGPSTQASMQLYVSLMKCTNALDAARREMLATVVSNVNGCFY